MVRKVFYSFHYQADVWRTFQVRNIGAVEGNKPASDNDWETVKRGGDAAIKRWIDSQLSGRSCTIVLIGKDTAGRQWINYEIEKSWNDKMGVLGIYIHNLKGQDSKQSPKGKNPFDEFSINHQKMSGIVKAYDPPYSDSQRVYEWIEQNLASLIEEAINIRKRC
ncbi:MAG: TIR domain-containing protein [Burkholderiaceae bacterium]|jgi:hypothetical protein|nr:TIR domain-containing protein [Burkholderiaceae bacterium]